MAKASGMLAMAAARIRSAAIISRRRLRTRSSQTPAGSEKSRWQQPDRGQRPHWVASAPSVSTATRGSAELGDLVAEDGDRLAEPEAPEIGCVEEQPRDETIDLERAQPRLGARDHRAAVTAGCSAAWPAGPGFPCRSRAGGSASRVGPCTARRATARSAPRPARRGSTTPSWAPTVSAAGDPIHQQERQDPKDDPCDAANHRDPPSSGSRVRAAQCRSP